MRRFLSPTKDGCIHAGRNMKVDEVKEFMDKLVEMAAQKALEKIEKEGLIEKKLAVLKNSGPRSVHGLAELAEYMNRSVPTISRWKKEGLLDGCYRQIGKTITFNLDLIDKKFKVVGHPPTPEGLSL